MRKLKSFVNLGVGLIIVTLGTSAWAVDITGTWSGKEGCKCFNDVDGKVTERFKNEDMRISQNGTDLNILVFGELFNGNVINHPQKDNKGEAAFIACNTDPNNNASFGEIGRAKLSTKSNGNGKFKVESLWNSSKTQICTCKWNFKRTDTQDPSIADCS
jgi:hypothetical protein